MTGRVLWHGAALLSISLALRAGPESSSAPVTAFRTDTSTDDKLPWYQLRPNEFPPEGAAHAFAGELVAVDHVNRVGVIRTDRTDKQNRSHWDLPVRFTLLPYASVRYHGAFASLKDIPLGTHLHGQFYLKPADEAPRPPPQDGRVSIDADFNRAFLIEDDFSHQQRLGRLWRIDAVDSATAGKLTVTGVKPDGSEPDAKATQFEIPATTRIWKGKQIGAVGDLAPGQLVRLNLTRATLYGPGRCLDVWIDEESRSIATERQRQNHLAYMKEHGLPGWIDAVDNAQKHLTVTLFAGFDPALIENFKVIEAPVVKPGEVATPDASITTLVAEPSLRSYDQVNDRKSGAKLALEQIPLVPGCSGWRIRFAVGDLLEGYRPGRIVRLLPAGWPLTDLPREERLWPGDVAIPLAK